MKLITLLLLISISNAALSFDEGGGNGGGNGGDRVGNGGDIVLCAPNGVEFIYILDEYEATKKIQLGNPNLSYTEKLNTLFLRVKKHFPQRYEYYSSVLKKFNDNVRFVTTKLPEINDSRDGLGVSCDLSQAAYFFKDKRLGFQYYIQKQFWNLLSEDQKAILVMHEIIYTEATELLHKNSRNVRKINIELFTNTEINPSIIDSLFFSEINKGITPGKINEYLLGTYSAKMAKTILYLDLSEFYQVQNFKQTLIELKRRFSTDKEVIALIDNHLRRI